MIEQALRYGELQIPYQVLFVPERRRRVAIHVRPDGAVRVEAPDGVPLAEIKAAVTKRAGWLEEQLRRIRTRGAHVLPREYVSGESHFYLGRRHLLKVRRSAQETPSVKLRYGRLEVVSGETDRESVRGLLLAWYRTRAEIVFAPRLDELVSDLSWVRTAPEWKLVQMRRQWGSCSPKGVLNLNPHLVKAPATCIDYVLLHELCHLKVHNHSPRFYRLLSRHMPHWEVVKGRLDGMAEMLLNV